MKRMTWVDRNDRVYNYDNDDKDYVGNKDNKEDHSWMTMMK